MPPFVPVQVADYQKWGELVLSWSLGTANPPGVSFADPTVTRFVFSDPAAPKQIGSASTLVTFPDSVQEVVFVRDTATRRYVRLPDPVMALAAQSEMAAGANYGLPSFYLNAPINGSLPNEGAQKIVLQAERVGDYSIGSCM